jgi:3-deoxy-manno-octulosonate cytidylyltransferase (CMP-KDO synthetase)
MKDVLGIIPARYGSTRFPGKPLAEIQGKPMIQWVYERASEVFDVLYVATDDARVRKTVRRFHGDCIMTSPDHPSGTDRCLEAYRKIRKKTDRKFKTVINIQGDEPLVRTEQIKELVSCFDISGTDIATLIQPCTDPEELDRTDVVKVVVDRTFRALYFSRLPVPYQREARQEGPVITHFKHIGMYGYRTKVLKEICSLPPSKLEKAESLEQLRWLEHGYRIQTRISDYESLGVDTPQDLERVVRAMQGH